MFAALLATPMTHAGALITAPGSVECAPVGYATRPQMTPCSVIFYKGSLAIAWRSLIIRDNQDDPTQGHYRKQFFAMRLAKTVIRPNERVRY